MAASVDAPRFGPKRMTLREIAAAFYKWGQVDAVDMERTVGGLSFTGQGFTVGGIPLDGVRDDYYRAQPLRRPVDQQ